MKVKVIRSIANSLCQMCCSARINTSLQRIADLADATVRIDLLSGSCAHTIAGEVDLPMVEDFRSWLSAQFEQAKLSFDALQRALLSLEYKTDRVATDRSRILLFELESQSELWIADRLVEGHAINALWLVRKAG